MKPSDALKTWEAAIKLAREKSDQERGRGEVEDLRSEPEAQDLPEEVSPEASD